MSRPSASAGIFETDGGANPVYKFNLEDNQISHDGSLGWLIENAEPESFTVSSGGDTNEIKITSDELIPVVMDVDIGSFLWADDMSDWGRVTSISHDGTDHIIAGTWKAAPSGTWHYYNIQHIDEKGTVVLGGRRRLARQMYAPSLSKDNAGRLVKYQIDDIFDFSVGSMFTYVLGYVHKAAIRVRRPYTGNTVTPLVKIQLDDGTSNVTYISMAADVEGYAEARIDGTYEKPASIPTLTQLDASKAIEKVTFTYGVGDLYEGDEFEMPKISFYLEVEPLD